MSAGPVPRRVLFGAAVALTVAGTLGIALAPALLTYSPLLLLALSPLPRHLLLVAPLTAIVPFVMIASLRSALASCVGYGFGLSYGESGLELARSRYPRLAPFAGALERFFRRAGPFALLLAPGPMFAALAGVTRMRFGLFATIQVVGHVMWAAITYRIGEALSEWIAPVLAFVRAYVVEATLACVVLIVAYRLVQRRKRAHDVLDTLGVAHPPSLSPGEEAPPS